MSNITDLSKERTIKLINSQIGINKSNSNIEKALDDADERARIYNFEIIQAEKELIIKGIQPRVCYNGVCDKNNHSDECQNAHCRPISCMHRMTSIPPNRLDYREYMPSHREALDVLEKNELLKGDREEYLEDSIYYNKARNSDERHNTEIKGIDFNMLTKCVMTSLSNCVDFIKGEDGVDLTDYINPETFSRNVCCEVEKAMGIYPNIKLI